MTDQLETIRQAIINDPENKHFTNQGIMPLYTAPATAKINIIGQAPGIKAQEKQRYWDGASGDRLREWLGIDRDTFYSSEKIAIMPMDFYYPGKGKSGDLPPRPDFADKWHPKLLKLMPNIQLTILIGAYAQHYYLNLPKSSKSTDMIEHYQTYLPEFWPIVHPSPRNNIWLKKHPWFEADVVPELQKKIRQLIF